MKEIIKFLVFTVLFSAFLVALPTSAQISEPLYLIEITGTELLPDTIYAGDVVSLSVNIKDRGTVLEIRDLNAILDVGNQFEELDIQDFISLINAKSTKPVLFKFKVKEDLVPGLYPVFLTMNYIRDGKENVQTDTILIPVSNTEKNLLVNVSPNSINPGTQTEMVFSVENAGSAPISNVSFSWVEENKLILPLGSDNKKYLTNFTRGEIKTFTYTITADSTITPGIYPLDVTINFNDANGVNSQNSVVGLVVGGKTDFEISADSFTNSQLSLSIANVGKNNAGAVVVRIPRQQDISIIGSDISILGNLNKGDFTIANFQINLQSQSLDSNAFRNVQQARSEISENIAESFRNRQGQETIRQGELPSFQDQNLERAGFSKTGLQVEVDYTDTTGERQTVKKTINLDSFVSSRQTVFGANENFSVRSNAKLPLVEQWSSFGLLVLLALAYNFLKSKADWKKLLVILAINAGIFAAIIYLLSANMLYISIAGIISSFLLFWFSLSRISEDV